MDRWDNPEELHRDHDTALHLIRQQGVIFADDPIAKGQAREILAKIFLAIYGRFSKERSCVLMSSGLIRHWNASRLSGSRNLWTGKDTGFMRNLCLKCESG